MLQMTSRLTPKSLLFIYMHAQYYISWRGGRHGDRIRMNSTNSPRASFRRSSGGCSPNKALSGGLSTSSAPALLLFRCRYPRCHVRHFSPTGEQTSTCKAFHFSQEGSVSGNVHHVQHQRSEQWAQHRQDSCKSTFTLRSTAKCFRSNVEPPSWL